MQGHDSTPQNLEWVDICVVLGVVEVSLCDIRDSWATH